MSELRIGDWNALGQDASAVRRAVFVQEQGIAAEDEWDAADAQCLHAVLSDELHQPVATGRLLPAEAGVAHIGRMAVLRHQRGKGWGARVLQALEHAARARGDQAIELSAQCSAQGFYARQGYVAQGLPYDEVGIAHVRMRKLLS